MCNYIHYDITQRIVTQLLFGLAAPQSVIGLSCWATMPANGESTPVRNPPASDSSPSSSHSPFPELEYITCEFAKQFGTKQEVWDRVAWATWENNGRRMLTWGDLRIGESGKPVSAARSVGQWHRGSHNRYAAPGHLNLGLGRDVWYTTKDQVRVSLGLERDHEFGGDSEKGKLWYETVIGICNARRDDAAPRAGARAQPY